MSGPGLRGRVDRLGRRWPWLGWVLEVQGRATELRGSATAASITLNAFLSLFPLLVLGIAVLGFVSHESTDLADRIVDQLGITGEAATVVTDAVEAAERSRTTATVVGLLGLLWTGLRLARSLALAYDTAWRVPSRAVRARLVGIAWLAGSGLVLAATFTATGAVQWLPPVFAPLGIAVGLATSVGLWLWTSWVLPNRRVPVRALVPAALVGAVGFEVLKVVGTIAVPRLVANSSALYGSIGVVFAILVWLLFFGRLVVYVTVVEVLGWERDHGTETAEVELPALPG